MMEVAMLIQKATETTKSLFDHSDHFKFKLRSEQKNDEPTLNG